MEAGVVSVRNRVTGTEAEPVAYRDRNGTVTWARRTAERPFADFTDRSTRRGYIMNFVVPVRGGPALQGKRVEVRRHLRAGQVVAGRRTNTLCPRRTG